MILVFFPIQMLPYFRSMEAFLQIIPTQGQAVSI